MAHKERHYAARMMRDGLDGLGNQLDLKVLADIPPLEWPANAGKTFLRVLTNPEAGEADRLIAAELGGDFTVINDALSDALIGIAGRADESAQMRATAAISLGAVLEYADTSMVEESFEEDADVSISEETFRDLKAALHKLYLDNGAPKLVRRRILEASVRAPQEWHHDAIRRAYSSGDRDWMLTAVFAMRYVRGFDVEILDALKSIDSDIQYEAVTAAGNWEMDAAWSHIAGLVGCPGHRVT